MLSALSANVNQKLRRTLVLFPGSLGDIICALPAFSFLRRNGAEKLVLATRGEAFDLCTSFLFSDEVISLETSGFSQLFLNPRQISISDDLLQFFSRFSAIFSWYGYERSEVRENLLRLSSAEIWSFAFFTGQRECHAVSYYLDCLNKEMLSCPSLSIPDNMLRWREEFWQKYQTKTFSPTLIIHPGSGGKRKRWDSEGFRQVGIWWQEKKKGKVIILLGPAEKNELQKWRSIGEVEVALSLLQVAALLSRADLYLGNDSGISHLAGAIGARGVVLFGPTLPKKWRPLGGNMVVVRNSAYRDVFPNREGIALKEIAVEEVIAHLILMGG